MQTRYHDGLTKHRLNVSSNILLPNKYKTVVTLRYALSCKHMKLASIFEFIEIEYFALNFVYSVLYFAREIK